MRAFFFLAPLVAFLFSALPVPALEPDEILRNPALEARAREIGRSLRCLVCQNQSIDDSDAPLARDLRLLVRERLAAGDGDRQIVDYIVARYGEFVLLRPPFKPATFALWIGPWVLLAVGAAAIAIRCRRVRAEAEPLSEQERRRLEAMLATPKE